MSLDRSLISFDSDSCFMKSYDLDPRGISMTPISIRNALQHNYLDTEDRYISKVAGSSNQIFAQNADPSLQQSEDRTTVQSSDSSLHYPEDQTTAQPQLINLANHSEDRTTAQYSDSAIYSPADRTTAQPFALMSDRLEDRTTCQKDKSYTPQAELLPVEFKKRIQGQTVQHYIVREKEPFSVRFAHFKEQILSAIRKMVDFKQKQSNSTRQLPEARTSKPQPLIGQIDRPIHDVMTTEVLLSPEQYQKVLRELDHCRISLAKELARNGKLRDAIAQAHKIHETSRFFQDAQTLLRSWKQI
jgi:hypothetical protein